MYTLPQNHALLARKVMEMAPEQFDAQVATAEALLRLGTRQEVTDGDDLAKVHLALAHQVNFQVAQNIDALVLESASSSHSRQSQQFRDRWISPLAKAVLGDIETLESGYLGSIPSVRTAAGYTARSIPLSSYR